MWFSCFLLWLCCNAQTRYPEGFRIHMFILITRSSQGSRMCEIGCVLVRDCGGEVSMLCDGGA